MHGRWVLKWLLVEGLLASVAMAAWDDDGLTYPIEGLCRRWDHQSTVDEQRRKLYLVGGYVLLKEHLSNGSTIGFEGEPSSEFLELDLTQTWSLEKDKEGITLPPWKAVEYTTDEGAPYAPLAVAGGGMWSASPEGRLYLFDGMRTKNPSVYDKSCLMSYDIERSHWSYQEMEMLDDPPYRFSRGTSVGTGKDFGFYVGGARVYQNGKDKRWYYPLGQQLSRLNWTEPGDYPTQVIGQLDRGRKTMGAAVAYLPVGELGSLIMIGGTDEENERTRGPGSGGDQIADVPPASTAMNRREEVWIYDIKNSKWYIQETTGEGPYERMGGCAVAVSAPDGKSHQVFLYGGGSGSRIFGMDDASYMGDLFVLQLPSFVWYAYNSDKTNVPAARTRHTCHVVNGRQMLILGGSRNDTSNTDISQGCVWDEMSVLDMATIEWQTEYRPATAPYFVPENILKDSMPKGTLISEPMKGWASSELAKLFDPKSGKPTSLPRAVVIGVAIGTTALFAVLVAAGCMFYRRRSAQRKQAPTSNQPSWGPTPLEAAPLVALTPAPPYSAYYMDKEQQAPVELPTSSKIYELPSNTTPVRSAPEGLDSPETPRGGLSVTVAASPGIVSPAAAVAAGSASPIPPYDRDVGDVQMPGSRSRKSRKLPARLDMLGGVWKWTRKKTPS